MQATAILPVKRFARAKTRLLDAIDKPARAALLRGMLADTLIALDACEPVERVILVTGEGRAEKEAMHWARRLRTPIEVLRDPQDRGHSEAATLGIVRALALGAGCTALVPGDCPLLDPAELAGALERNAGGQVSVIPDRSGEGTNGLILAPADAIAPAFGPGSCERHLDRASRAGFAAVREPLESMGLDVDTPGDLDELRAMLSEDPGRARRTALALDLT